MFKKSKSEKEDRGVRGWRGGGCGHSPLWESYPALCDITKGFKRRPSIFFCVKVQQQETRSRAAVTFCFFSHKCGIFKSFLCVFFLPSFWVLIGRCATSHGRCHLPRACADRNVVARSPRGIFFPCRTKKCYKCAPSSGFSAG